MSELDDLLKTLEGLPTDPEAKREWVDERSERLGDLMARAAGEITEFAATAYAVTLVAAGDIAALDGIEKIWYKFVTEVVGEYTAGMYLTGNLSAFVGVPGSGPPPEAAAAWASVVNENAVAYQATATNRIVGSSTNMWQDVRNKVTNNIQDGMSAEQTKSAIEEITGYSEFRADAIGRTEVQGAYAGGEMAGARALGEFGPIEKSWLSATDSRTRKTHLRADGQTVPIDEPFIIGSERMDRPLDPSASADEVVNCRCVVQLLYAGDERPDGSTVERADGSEEAVPERLAAPPEWKSEPIYFGDDSFGDNIEFTNTGASLGGQNPKQTFRSAVTGDDEFLFKPSEEWVAHGEALSTELAIRAGLNVPRVTAQKINGQWGTVQKLVPDSRKAFGNNGQYGFDPTLVTDSDLAEMQSHRMLDWLIGNNDAHGGQWIRTGPPGAASKVQGIDKGQAFKYFGKEKLDYKWKPADRLNDPDSVYAAMEKAYAEGRLGPKQFMKITRKPANNAASKTVDALMEIPDEEIRAMLRPYANGRYGPGSAADDFIESVIKRKTDLRLDMTRYHGRLSLANRKARGVHGMKGKTPPPNLPAGVGGPQGMEGALESKFDLEWAKLHDHPLMDRGLHEEAREYTGGAYREINNTLRKGQRDGRMAGINRSMQPINSDMTVHRGTTFDNLMDGNYGDLQGQVFLDRGFTSTFIDSSKGAPGIASGNVGMTVRMNRGQKGAWVDGISQHKGEREFILPSNSHFYVHKVRPSTGRGWESGYKTIMDVEVVSEDWALKNNVKVMEPGKGYIG